MKFYRQSYETPHEAVDRVLKQAKLNDKDAILVIFDKEFPIKQNSTTEEIIRLKHELRILSNIQKLIDKGLVQA
jgi:hypothetical protein